MSTEPFNDQLAEVERYELREPPRFRFEADRRQFVQVVGTGLMIVAASRSASAQRPRRRSSRREEPLSERFHIGADGLVTLLTSKVEVGQGSRTQLTQAVAEEFRLPIDRIRLIMADTAQCPDDGGTAGSRTTPSTVPRVRQAAARAREVLTKVAADRLQVDVSDIECDEGVFKTTNGKRFTLAEFAKDLNAQVEWMSATSDDDVTVSPVDGWRTLGTPVAKVDGRSVVTGAAKYPSDIVLPDMWYGKILRPDSFGATLESVDLAPARALPDVTVVRDDGFVGCAAPTTWAATKALDVLSNTATWNRSDNSPENDLFTHFKNTAFAERSGRRQGQNWGNVESALDNATHRIDAQYTVAYIQHAPMEPRAAVARWENGQLTVWTGTQQPARVHLELCRSFGLPNESVRVIVPDSGGGFGGKHTGEAAVEAARLAKAANRPVRVQWTRNEEFTWAYFRPAGLIEVQAGLDDSGRLAGWDFTNYNSGGSAIATPYRAAAGRTRFVRTDAPLRQGSYRALASTANTFARESAMDELAQLVDADPLEFRLQHLDDGRLKDVLLAACKKFVWSERRTNRSSKRGVGLACGTEKGSFVAACAEVEVIDGSIRVIDVCQAFECGAIHNPANLRAQIEGCLVMGLGGALYEEIELSKGTIANASFSSYRVPRMADLPSIDIVTLDRHDLDSAGAGETPIIAIAPAIANAVQHAVGVRCRSMPLHGIATSG